MNSESSAFKEDIRRAMEFKFSIQLFFRSKLTELFST